MSKAAKNNLSSVDINNNQTDSDNWLEIIPRNGLL